MIQRFTLCLLALIWPAALFASINLPGDPDGPLGSAAGVFRGTVLRIESYSNPADGLIFTRTVFQVDEALKGSFGSTVQVSHRGGELNGVGFTDDSSPQFRTGEEVVVFISRRTDGTLLATDGHAGVARLSHLPGGKYVPEQAALLSRLQSRISLQPRVQTSFSDQADSLALGGVSVGFKADSSGGSTNGLLADSSGIPSRYPLADRGEPIPYLVDATLLPSGMTLSNALAAVNSAMSVWAAASSFKFTFAGLTNFGAASANIFNSDGYFRIQLHDGYSYIPSGNILGVGGSWFSSGLLANANWGPGGKVSGMEFNNGLNGYVVLKHTNTVMQNITNFTEVLTHEIGHVIGLAHSSDIVTNDPILVDSIMYFLSHDDGRGARLSSYDTNVVREVHPLLTPPFTYPRFMDITTPYPGTGSPDIPGINSAELRGYSLQSTNLTLVVTNASGNTNVGNFSLVGNILKFVAIGYSGGSRWNPPDSGYYDIIYFRYSDGTNASPYKTTTTVSYNPDSNNPNYGTASDGIPDSWMTTYFGHADPRAGDKSRAGDDADGDKLTNLQEYIAGMNPKDRTSAQWITLVQTNLIQWQAKAYELYEVQVSTNLTGTNWVRSGNPVLPTNATASFSNFYSPTASPRFFRILKVP